MSQVEVSRQSVIPSHARASETYITPSWARLTSPRIEQKRLKTQMRKYIGEQQRTAGKPADMASETTFVAAAPGGGGVQLTHQRIRELHGDHQPLFVAPPPPHFFPSLPHSSAATNKPAITPVDSSPLKAPPLIRSTSAAELTTPLRLVVHRQPAPSNLKLSSPSRDLREPGAPVQPPAEAPVAAPSASTAPNGGVLLLSPSTIVVQPALAAAAPVKGKRGRKPKDPVAHAAKKEAKEKRRLEKEAAVAEAQIKEPQANEPQAAPTQPQQIVFVTEEIRGLNIVAPPQAPLPIAPITASRPTSSSSSLKDVVVVASRPSTSGRTSHLDPASTPPPSSFAAVFESKKRTADSAFANDITTTWLANGDSSMDVDDSTWTVTTPIDSPLHSPEQGGLGIFLQAPPSTPIEEILSSSAQLGINPALLLQEDIISSMNLSKAVRVLKSPLEILDEYQFHQVPSDEAGNPPDTPMDDSANRKLGLMDMMLLKSNDTEDRPSPKKKPRPDLVFSTTKRGKAVVSLQKNSPIPPAAAPVVEPEIPSTPVREVETADLRSIVLKRRQEVWGDEVGTEVTRITVHRRITSRKTSTGLMSPLSPTSTAKRMSTRNRDDTIMESDSDSSDSSDSEDDDEHVPQHSQAHASQVTPLATPTNPLVLASQSMQKSFSAPGLFYYRPAVVATENIFLPHTPQDDDDDFSGILRPEIRRLSRGFDGDTGMRCKTCGMLFRKQSVLSAHERTCMVKQTPFIPYDFLKDHVDDGGFGFGGRHLFNHDDIVLTPRNLAASFESPLLQQGLSVGKKGLGFVAPKDTVSSEDDEDDEIVTTGHRKVDGLGEITVGEPCGQTRCICNKPEKSVSGVMVQWYPPFDFRV